MVHTKKSATKTPSEKPSKKKESEVTPKRSGSASRSPGRSPGRTKSPGRPKSPSRSKANTSSEKPTRRKSTDLSKSPTRLSGRTGHLTPTRRSPIRSSPSRLTKEKDKVKESSIPVLKKQIVIESDSDSEAIDEKVEVKEKPKAAVRGRTRIDLTDKAEYRKEPSVESTSSSQVSKRITRSQHKEVERIVHLRHFDIASKKLTEFSDEDELVKESSVSSQISKPNYDYGGPIGVAFLMIFLPIAGFLLHAICTENSCAFDKIPNDLNELTKVSSYFDIKTILGYISFITLVAIISAIPFGGRKVIGLPDKHGKFIYVTNGFFSAIIIFTLIVLLSIRHIEVFPFILDHYLPLYVTAFSVGVLFSIYAYIRSLYVPVSALNPQIVDKNKLYTFFMGRELHPRIFKILDLKMYFYKVLFLSEMVINLAWLYTRYEMTSVVDGNEYDIYSRITQLQPTFMVFFFLQCMRIFDGLMYERSWITSKELQQEGFGYRMSVSYLLYPIISSITIRYIVEHNVQLAYWKLVLIALTYHTGHYMSRGSNNQKDAFRKNPYSPSFSRLETIPTAQGKKLLSSGYWGFVRHPNYLGHIIVELSFVPFALCAPPVLLRILNIVFLIFRARSDNNHCKQKYGAAWDRYCNKVRYLLIPKVY